MHRDQLVAYLDDHLNADAVSDAAVNGLQVEGRPEVRRIATAVSASAALFRAAAAWGADAVLVHHGLLWRGTDPVPITGAARERLRLLLANEVNLIAYHLPLDRHPEHGNNAVLARTLGLEHLEPFGTYHGAHIGFAGVFPQPVERVELVRRVREATGQEPLVFPPAEQPVIASVGIVSGGAPEIFGEAIASGLDAFITGEAREWVLHRAAEEGVTFLAAGHYATERFGVRALGDHLAEHFDLEIRFFDFPNPV